MDIVVMTIDRTPENYIVVNTSVNLLHCPVKLQRAALEALGYRPPLRNPVLGALARAVVEREARRHGGKVPLGGLELSVDDLTDIPPAPLSS